MPTDLLKAYLVMLPRLNAAESLLASTRMAVGAHGLRKGRGDSIRRAWMRTAQQGAMRPLKAASERAYQVQMGRVGLRVRRVPSGARGPSGEP